MPEQFKMEIDKMEMEKMRTNYDIEKHPLLGPIYQEVKAEGKAEGKAKGEAAAKVHLLHAQLEAKFGHFLAGQPSASKTPSPHTA